MRRERKGRQGLTIWSKKLWSHAPHQPHCRMIRTYLSCLVILFLSFISAKVGSDPNSTETPFATQWGTFQPKATWDIISANLPIGRQDPSQRALKSSLPTDIHSRRHSLSQGVAFHHQQRVKGSVLSDGAQQVLVVSRKERSWAWGGVALRSLQWQPKWYLRPCAKLSPRTGRARLSLGSAGWCSQAITGSARQALSHLQLPDLLSWLRGQVRFMFCH